jgi:hypothetical protein
MILGDNGVINNISAGSPGFDRDKNPKPALYGTRPAGVREKSRRKNIMENNYPIALLNTSIATIDGTYTLETIALDQAKELIEGKETISAVGHGPTARLMTDMLGIDVPENRIEFEQQPGQTALVFKLNRRLPEGKILSREEIEEIGYKFQILRREK